MPLAPASRRLTLALTVAVAAAVLVTRLSGAVPGQSFTFLASGFTQELIGVSTDLLDPEFGILGGVAFAGDADPIVAECQFQGTRIHRFDLGSTSPVHGSDIRAETILPSQGGCGMVNHPDGSVYVAMNDGINGIASVDRNTGAFSGFMGPPANALGIAVDPTNGHLVYAGQDCRFTTECTLIDLDPSSGSWSVFALLTADDTDLIDGMYFDPSGEYLFLSNRSPQFRLTILNREGCLGLSSDSCIAQHVPMTSEPDGVAFHASSPKFVVTNNIDGTMTRFDFPGDDYSAPPAPSVFASGGFRGDLTQVGPDGCIYLTQDGVRYDDLTESAPEDPDNSVVRVCGGFAPPPGVETPQEAGVIGDFVWQDLDQNGQQDFGEPGIEGVTVTLSNGSGPVATATTDGNGFYEFGPLASDTYTVSVTTPAGHTPTLANVGPDTSDSDGASANVTLAANGQDLTIDFGFVPAAAIGDFVWEDLNGNGLQESSEPGIGGVTVTISGGSISDSTTTDVNGLYAFGNLPPGTYTVSVVTPAGYTPSIANAGSDLIDSDGPSTVVSLQSGLDDMSNDFGFVVQAPPLGAISGFAYWDQNGDGMKNGSEPGIDNVLISLSGPLSGNTTTQIDGSYSFAELPAGTYSVSAPPTAAGKTLTTPSPLTVELDPGEIQPNVNFGYRAVAFRTQTQGGWGAPPNGNNPGALLAANFATVFPAGITIGGAKTLTFTSASAVEAFLPAGGKAGFLTASAVNPTRSSAGVFAGQVLALTISVAMSNAGVITSGLEDLYIAPGQTMAGYTVAEVLAMANQALGGNLSGLPSGVTISTLNDVVSKINENYVGGTEDHGFLVP
jgi:hypothetical protein